MADDVGLDTGEKKRTRIWQNGEGPMEKRQLLFGSSGLLPFRNWILCYQSFQFFKRSQKFRLLCELPSFFSVGSNWCFFVTLQDSMAYFFFRRHWHPFYLDWLIWWEQEVHMPVQILKGKEVEGEGEWGRHSAKCKDNKYWCFIFYQNIYISPPNWVLKMSKTCMIARNLQF